MKMFVDVAQIYLHRDAVDFRKSINGLQLIVEQKMTLSPFDEAIFVFCNKGRDKLKVLYWDQTGFCLWYKRLEKDKFKWPRKNTSSTFNVSSEQWNWLLSGYDINKMQGHQPLHYLSCVE
jgi:transposase